MTKRLISLLLALVMLLSLCMTACSSKPEEGAEGEEGAEDAADEIQRKNSALTIYAITDAKTTEEGLKLVEEKISNYCIAKYKTSIDLRFFTEAEYQAGLNAMYDKFAAEEAAKLQAEKEEAELLKSQAAYKATLSKEERQKYEQQLRLEAKKKAEEEKKKKEEEQALISQGKDVAVVKDVQMDIIYIPGINDYQSYLKQGLLQDIRPLLDGNFKRIKDYVYPAYLTAATVDSAIYGIPNNQGITTDETYFVVNQKMAEKYGVDWSKVRSITDLNSVFAKAKADGVTPIYGDFDPEGAYILNKEGLSQAACVYTDTLKGAKFEAKNMYTAINPKGTNSTAMLDYYKLKADYKQNGYISATDSSNFFLSVQKLNEEEKAAWEKKGYITVLYKGADFNNEAALNTGLFGISKHCQEPERAMEVLQLMYTDPQFRNLFAFGVEEQNYIVRADAEQDNIITIVDDSYSMDFFKTGNALIGYIPDTMDPQYIEKSKLKNLNSFMNPFLGFYYDWESEDSKKWLKIAAEWEAYLAPKLAELRAGDPNYQQVLQTVYDEVYENKSGLFTDSYKAFTTAFTLRASYISYTDKLIELSKVLHFENETSAPAEPAA